MFNYFWDELGGLLWNEDAFDNMFKLLAKRELTELVSMIFRSRTTTTIFEAMSYQYRFAFLDHLLQSRHDLLDELGSTVS